MHKRHATAGPHAFPVLKGALTCQCWRGGSDPVCLPFTVDVALEPQSSGAQAEVLSSGWEAA
jgi:hypothetical protein